MRAPSKSLPGASAFRSIGIMVLASGLAVTPLLGDPRQAVHDPAVGPGAARGIPENSLERASWLLRRTLEASGGAVAVDSVATLRLEATVAAGGVDSTVTTWLSFPRRFRRDLKAGAHTLTALVVPEGAFLISDGEAYPMTEVERFEVEAAVVRDPIVLLKSRHQETFMSFADGPEAIDGTVYEKLRIDAGGTTTTVLIEPETGLVRRIRYPRLKRGRDTDELVEATYSDFRTIDGLTYPFRMESIEGTTVVEKLEVNPALDRRLFYPPRVQDPARGGS